MIIGVDLGSSFIKTVVINRDANVLGTGSAPVPYSTLSGAYVEMNVPDIETAFRDSLCESMQAAGIKKHDVLAVAMTSQAQTFTVADEHGSPRFPFISWRDSRSEVDNVAEAALPDFSRHCSVESCLPGITVAQLAYGKHHNTLNVMQGDTLLFLPTWFVKALTGTAVVDSNLAAMSGLYSLETGTWWDAALTLCGLTPQQLPGLTSIGEPAAWTTDAAQLFGLPSGIPVVLAGNDQTAGAYSAAIEQRHAILITLGTAQVVYACHPSMPAAVPGTMRGPYPRGGFYQLGADNYGAGTVNWVLSTVGQGMSPKTFDRLVAKAPQDCHGVRFIPDGPAGTGRWTGMEHPSATLEDQMRSVLVCLLDKMETMFTKMGLMDFDGEVWVAGGGRHSEPWMQGLQERLGMPMQRCDQADAGRGAARLALECLQR